MLKPFDLQALSIFFCIKVALVTDPCMGSGHILVYAFDVLMQIYTSQGYVERDAAKSILMNNLYGIDIDVRAYQLAYFAVMMKARQYNRKIFSEHIMPNLIAIRNPENISKSVLKRLGGLEPVGLRLVEEFEDAEEYGSILQPNVTLDELDRLVKQLDEIDRMADYGNLLVQMESAECCNLLWPLIKQAKLLNQKYDVVVTNPPYMGAANMNLRLSQYIYNYYSDYRSDFFSAFIIRISDMVKRKRYCGLFVPFVWMFIHSYEKLREYLYAQCSIQSLIQFEYSAFEEATVPVCTFILMNSYMNKRKGCYLRLTDFRGGMEIQRQKTLEAINNHKCGYYYEQTTANYSMIPGAPVAYWASNKLFEVFQCGKSLSDFGVTKVGLQTGDTNRFLRLWFEVNSNKSSFINCFPNSLRKWIPICKGGEFRKWYGNHEYLVNWENNGYEIRNFRDEKGKLKSRPQNIDYYFKEGLNWNLITSGDFAARYFPAGMIFDVSANAFFEKSNNRNYLLGLLNSKIIKEIAKILNPTINLSAGVVANFPIVENSQEKDSVEKICIENIHLSKEDWDSFETSWDFLKNPLLPRIRFGSDNDFTDIDVKFDSIIYTSSTIKNEFENWQDKCSRRFNQLKINEEKLNCIFIDIYGLQDELTPDVADKDVTVRKADLGRDIRSLVSYAVGCMFGRYSLDVPGLAYAGGDWDDSRYTLFVPDADNCIPITDEEYFTDDIVGRFVEFIRVVYGAETLEKNLDFVADALGNKGNTSREVIRNYFLNDFYKDHLKVYQKRPIYWLFDSGKQNGFKALVYMHRWNADTVGNLRIEYLHKMQNVYEHEINTCQEMIDHGFGRDVAVNTKRKEKLVKQLKECKDYDALVAHIAFSKIDIDLDDGVKVNYRKVQTGADGKFCEILANSKEVMAKEK